LASAIAKENGKYDARLGLLLFLALENIRIYFTLFGRRKVIDLILPKDRPL